MIDQSRKSRRMRVRFRDGGPTIVGVTCWDASRWLTHRPGVPNFLCHWRIHHGQDTETDPDCPYARRGLFAVPLLSPDPPALRPLDIAVIFVYFAAVIVAGLRLAGRQHDASDYFLGHRGLPWWALMLSIVATETSAVTVISVPGLAARGNLTFLQVAFGYLLGRIGVARLLLPGYFEGTQDTAYQRLERRLWGAARRTASGVFLVRPALADCVRIFAAAIPLGIITQWNFAAGILALRIVTLIYTWVGGLRAVVGVDVIQLGGYLLGGIATVIRAT